MKNIFLFGILLSIFLNTRMNAYAEEKVEAGQRTSYGEELGASMMISSGILWVWGSDLSDSGKGRLAFSKKIQDAVDKDLKIKPLTLNYQAINSNPVSFFSEAVEKFGRNRWKASLMLMTEIDETKYKLSDFTTVFHQTKQSKAIKTITEFAVTHAFHDTNKERILASYSIGRTNGGMGIEPIVENILKQVREGHDNGSVTLRVVPSHEYIRKATIFEEKANSMLIKGKIFKGLAILGGAFSQPIIAGAFQTESNTSVLGSKPEQAKKSSEFALVPAVATTEAVDAQ